MFEGIMMPLENKFGIDPLSTVIHIMPLLVGNEKPAKALDRFKSYLVSQIKRGITKQEELSMVEGIYKYIMTEPGSDERLIAMKYLFELQFLN